MKGLQVQHIHLHKRFYDIQVHWDKPTYEPDNYMIEINISPDEHDFVSQYLPGVSKIIQKYFSFAFALVDTIRIFFFYF